MPWRKQNVTRRESRTDPDKQTGLRGPATENLKSDLDELLDEIDRVLEKNAAAFQVIGSSQISAGPLRPQQPL